MPNAGDPVLAGDFPAGVSDTQSTSGLTTSTSYTTILSGGTTCGVAFTAPTSGRVLVNNFAHLFNAGANGTFCGWILRTGSSIGSGSTVTAADDARAIVNATASLEGFGSVHMVTGLTGGSSYNVQQAFKVSAGTGTFRNKHLTVYPTT